MTDSNSHVVITEEHTNQQSVAASDNTQPKSTLSFIDLYSGLTAGNYGT